MAARQPTPRRKAVPSRKGRPRAGGPTPGLSAAELLRRLDHPLKKDIEAVRRIILGVSPRIAEGIKWNSLSFRTTEFFATVNCRCRDSVQLVFHRGAKVKDNTTETRVADPAGLVKWLASDRCLVTVGAGRDISARRAALSDIVRAWIAQL
jgi:hypothetical protein